MKNNSPNSLLNTTNSGLVQNYRITGNYNFAKNWSLQFFTFFQGRNFNLQGYRTNPISHSIAIKKDIMSKKGMLGLGIDNFATPTYKVDSFAHSPYFEQTTTNTLYNFIVKVNFSYKIGKLIPEKKSKKSFESEE